MHEKIIDVDGLVELLQDFPGHSIAYMRLLTVPKFNKKSRITGFTMQNQIGINPDHIRKVSIWSVRLGYSYQTSVFNELHREGHQSSDFKPGISWHVPYTTPSGIISKTVVQHPQTKELYISVILNKWREGALISPVTQKMKESRNRSEYVNIINGKIIPKSLLKEFLPPKSDIKNQGVEVGNEIEYRTLKLASVKRLAFQGKVYNLA